MPQSRPIAIDVNDRPVHGTVHVKADRPAPKGAVLLCDRQCNEDDDPRDDFIGALIESLAIAGLAVARYRTPASVTKPETLARRVIDASAIFRWVLEHEVPDSSRLGVLGYDVGALVGVGLATREPDLRRLCLVNPIQPAPAPDDRPELDIMRQFADFDRPTMILHGTADTDVDPAHSLRFVKALGAGDRNVDHRFVARADHAFTSPNARAATLLVITQFFEGLARERKYSA